MTRLSVHATYLTSSQAAELLGVTAATLYAYVSRGLLQSHPVPDHPRARRYRRAEVTALVARRMMRRDPDAGAATTLDWGAPVLDSALTCIEGGRCFYRGLDALELAGKASVEEVAALLWTGDRTTAANLFADAKPATPRDPSELFETVEPLQRCQIALPAAAAADAASWDLRPAAAIATGTRVLVTMIDSACGRYDASLGIAGSLARAWSVSEREDDIRAALIVCADHELNVSSFTARCVASAQSTLYDVVLAGLAALRGRRHGGMSARVHALVREVETGGDAAEVVRDRMRRGEDLPGFGHRLYPDGDPRGAFLLRRATPKDATITALTAAVAKILGEQANLDVGLVALVRALGLPIGSELTLFGIGRAIGWIGHALEELAANRLIRPRALYTGPAPEIS